ncbi:MAG: proline--tRNA ligase [Candidatus Buchananbacteria bacterium RIFCSPLOWO2_01_FULL_46_12]|uniref:Proline--tRNA ligase n=1 Tax=Candidatus Buchananbacteria bacterium RIFCSPLOWO2_01_FULL_46_12 TaxID=1797546 RepID=A0A1G1YRU3_9BACT|nr:MAG: proline--tRNA ligase [Candidatus Buchananbacteria bacterium RIFCSPLOWO2_01_FULL_46_12]
MLKNEFAKRDLPKKSENLSDWYNKIILMAELADYGPAKGTMIYRPYGFAIWELVQKEMDRLIKERGVDNGYFPLFIPESLLKKEQAHVEGFSPELAVVTIGGGEELSEKLVVRPTSETIMYDAYSRWIHSWRDLPLMINQWNNVVRWEKRTYLFLRTTEFLWQEGHTAHATHDEAWDMVRWAMDMYQKVYRELFAMPGYVGRKSESEKFAGADTTLSFESLMPEGKALQSCTSHDLGQNFSKAFNISFLNSEGATEHVWQTSWGLSTRSIGGLIMMHGDDAGLVLPPRLAPVQVIVLPVRTEEKILISCEEVAETLRESGVRIKVDSLDNESLGSKINKWELKGVPLRIEIGMREIDQGTITAVRRDTGEKLNFLRDNLKTEMQTLLSRVQDNLYQKAEEFLKENTRSVDTYDEFKKTLSINRGFLSAFWCEGAECEAKIKEETKATTRCLPLDTEGQDGICVYCGAKAKHKWLFGQAY